MASHGGLRCSESGFGEHVAYDHLREGYRRLLETNPFLMKPLISMTMTLLLSLSLQAQQPPVSENADTNRVNSTGREQRQTNARASLNQVMNELQNDPETLFDRLDRNSDGQLSKEEFGRITNSGVEGAATTQGTGGTTAGGAEASPGTTGQSAVQGNTTSPSQPDSAQPQEQGQGNPVAPQGSTGNAPTPPAASPSGAVPDKK